MTHKYLCDDGNAEIEIEANSAEEAAQEYVDGGDWGDRSETNWIDVYVQRDVTDIETRLKGAIGDTPYSDHDTGWWVYGVDGIDIDALHALLPECKITVDDADNIDVDHGYSRARTTITLDAEEPECADGEEHDWRSPYSVLGGLKENPGAWGHGGGVIIKEVCAHCGRYKITDTWAQRPDTGEQGLESVEYRDPDDDSMAWLARRLRTRALEVEAPDGYTADDTGETKLYLVRDEDAERVLVTEDEQREVIESESWDSIIEQFEPIEADETQQN